MSDSAETPRSSTAPAPPESPPPANNSSPPPANSSPPPAHSSPPPVAHEDAVENEVGSSPPPAEENDSSPPPPGEGSSSPPPSPPKSSSSPPPEEAAPNPPSSPPPSQNSGSPPAAAASPPPNSPSPSPPPSSTSPPASTTPHNSSPSPPVSSGSTPSPPPAEEQSPKSSSTTTSSPPPPVQFVPPPPNSVAVNSPPVSTEFRAPPPPISSSSSNTPSSGSTTPSQSTSNGSSSSSSPGTSSGTATNNTNTASRNTTTTTNAVIGGVLAGVVLIAVVVLFFLVRKRRKRKDFYTSSYMPPKNFTVKTDGAVSGYSGSAPQNYSYVSHSPDSYGSQLLSSESNFLGATQTNFSYDDVMEITEGFSRQNIIGEGGFGCVFKGHLSGGKAVAVKQLKTGSGQGDREFKAEVEIISRVHHRHLVSLVGYCISDRQRLLLYEFVPNKTLEHHLHAAKGMPVLDWSKRLKIAIGSAKGLAYLHEDCHPKIIHRDIKSANILLDDNFDAQVADFGLARLNDSSQTHVSTRVMGTFGYLAPEYASSGKLTDRSDVFSFGVVLLELITGRKPVDPTQPLGDESLVEWARPHLLHAVETGDVSELVDSRLEKRYVESEIFRMIETAAACVRHSAPKRPRMAQVVRALDCDESDLTNGVKYGQSTAYNSGQYNEDIMNFRRTAFSTDTSELETTTSGEYTYTSGDLSNYTSRELETQAMRYGGGKR